MEFNGFDPGRQGPQHRVQMGTLQRWQVDGPPRNAQPPGPAVQGFVAGLGLCLAVAAQQLRSPVLGGAESAHWDWLRTALALGVSLTVWISRRSPSYARALTALCCMAFVASVLEALIARPTLALPLLLGCTLAVGGMSSWWTPAARSTLRRPRHEGDPERPDTMGDGDRITPAVAPGIQEFPLRVGRLAPLMFNLMLLVAHWQSSELGARQGIATHGLFFLGTLVGLIWTARWMHWPTLVIQLARTWRSAPTVPGTTEAPERPTHSIQLSGDEEKPPRSGQPRTADPGRSGWAGTLPALASLARLPLRPQGLLLLGAVLSGLLPLATLTLGTAGSLEESLDWMLIGTVICALLTLRHDWVELEFRRLGHALPGKQGPTHSPHALMVLGADLMGLGKKYLLSPTAGTLARPLAAYFLGLIATGTVLLSFSFCTRDGTPLDLLDALFTAVSAACVTGLSVIDISQRLSGEGQLVVLVLIQLGAIGIMGMYAVVLLAIGSPGDRKSAAMLEEALGPRIIRMERPNTPEPGSPAVFETLRKDLNEAPKGKGEVPRRPEGLRMLFVIVLVVELIGASVLTLLFHLHGDDWTQAAWRGLFTSISAYCNAGFSLQTDSLIAYQSSPAIMATISLLVIAGSISPFALALLFLKNRRMMSHQLERDLSLRTTGFLLVFGGALISLFEWSSSLAHLGGFEAAVNGFFHGATLRTAGFNSTDMTTLNAATIPLMVGLMFVGGSPGSTAGGAKTTTAALLIAALRAAIAGKTQVEIRKVQIGPGVLYLAIAVMTMNSLLILTGTTALLLTQNLEQGLNPLKLFFEVVSAVNTVGLTMDDTTTALNRMGQQIIVACMFLGRIGPLSLILVLATRARHHEQTPPSRKVRVG